MKEITDEHWEKIFALRDKIALKFYKRYMYGYQKEVSNKIIKAVILNTGEVIAIEHSRQSGKTEGVVITCKFLQHFYYPICAQLGIIAPDFFNIGIFAPQQEQARTDFNRMREYGDNMKEAFPFTYMGNNSFEYSIKTSDFPQRTTYCFTLSPTSNCESKTLHLIIFEEAQDLEDFKIDKTATPMGTNTNAVEVYIGTAGYRNNKFKRYLDSLPPEQKVVVPYTRAIQEREDAYKATGDPLHLNYAKKIRQRIRDLGEDSDEFKTQYALIWVLERGQFITYDKLFNLEKPYKILIKEVNPVTFGDDLEGLKPLKIPIAPYVGKCTAGIDWGKSNDSTILTIINDKGQIIYWLDLKGDDYSSQIHILGYVIFNYFPNCKRVNYDSTASQDMAGDPLKAKLRGRWNEIKCIGVPFTSKNKHLMYTNLSRLMHGIVVEGNVVEEPWMSFPNEWEGPEKDRFLKQMLDLQKEIKNNMWSCHHPDGNAYHDDYCDSVALAVWDEKNNAGGKKKRITKVH